MAHLSAALEYADQLEERTVMVDFNDYEMEV